MKNFKRYVTLTISGFVLVGSLTGCAKVNMENLNSLEDENSKQDRIIQKMSCLQFSAPVTAIKIGFTGNMEEVGHMSDGTPIYLEKYLQVENIITDFIINGEMPICMDVIDEDGKMIPKQFSAYRNGQDGSLIIFPNAVVEQELVGKEQVVYEENGQLITQEIPLYKSNLLFTTGEIVTETECYIDVTEENHYTLLSDVESIQR